MSKLTWNDDSGLMILWKSHRSYELTVNQMLELRTALRMRKDELLEWAKIARSKKREKVDARDLEDVEKLLHMMG